MSEYSEVEQPFLQQLAELGWTAIDQGTGVPQDPAPSLRGNFRQWLLPDVFNAAVREIIAVSPAPTPAPRYATALTPPPRPHPLPTVPAIRIRLRQIEAGNFGDVEPVGEGVSELRIHVGAGYRVYFGRHGKAVVILLCGGDKGSQKADVKHAKELWAEWKRRQA